MSSETVSPAVLFQSVSDAVRLRLLRLLHREELNVQELVRVLGMSQPRISKHLAVLREVGWLRQRKEGTWSWYSTVPRSDFPGGPALYDAVVAVADRSAEAAEDDAGLGQVLTDRAARAQDFFAGIAGKWDDIRRAYEHSDIQLAAISALAAERLRVIDIGTGTGALLPLLAGAVDQVVAVDSSEAMLGRARALCQRSGLTGIEFQRADIQALPFAESTFDVAFCSMVLHHMAQPAAAVAEVARVVRPGGKVVIIAFTRHNLTWMRDELAHQWLGFDQRDVERLCRQAGLRPRRYLVRRGSRAAATWAHRPATRKGEPWAWPDVFLSLAIKEQ
jgi:ArsR family transcriptional regulator